MKLLLNCFFTNENIDGCDYAVLDLTPRFAAWCIGRIASLKAEKDSEAGNNIHEEYYFRCDAEFIDYAYDVSVALDTAISDVNDAGFTTLPDDLEIPIKMDARTECNQTIICEDAIAFFCYPKHVDCGVTTSEIGLETLRSVGHPPIGVGHCVVCGHYGDDCTGNAE